jgi:putative FmdB family regulatory protein
MPTYHYRCDACGHAFDAFQKFSEDPLRICPECEGAIRRVIQPTPVVFKGSGWYITDSKGTGGAGPAKPAEAAATSDSTPAAKSEVKTESAAKPEKVATPAD